MITKFTENSFDYYRSEADEKPIAHIGFSLLDNSQTYLVEHTWVDESARGTGLAGKITKDFLAKVADKSKKIIPLCPYTKKFFEKHSEYQYLLKAENN
ncbi:MAG: GNAT family N-acetyltransferase [Liquorilactobacillus sp.]|uniref:GNAT family N-acetyltransferase n=1 Tax=Liquorilactobacillus sp. TaxID=2767923 RepID=UPI0039EAE8CF